MIQSPDHPGGKTVRFALGVHPKNIVAQFVVDRVDPLSLGVVLSALLPILGMH